MTANQINYAKTLEEGRHNRVTERIQRHQARSSRIQAEAASTSAEVSRRAQVETERTNREKEAINWYSAFETRRSNVAAEVEQQRTNLARESETARSNLAKESIDRFNAQTSYNRFIEESAHWQRQDDISSTNAESQRISALANSMQAQVAGLRQQEEVRANLKREAQNRTMFSETTRHNLETEAISRKQFNADAAHMQRQDYVAERNSDTNRIGVWTGLAGSIARALG